MPDFLSIPFAHIRDLISRSDLNVNHEQEVSFMWTIKLIVRYKVVKVAETVCT